LAADPASVVYITHIIAASASLFCVYNRTVSSVAAGSPQSFILVLCAAHVRADRQRQRRVERYAERSAEVTADILGAGRECESAVETTAHD